MKAVLLFLDVVFLFAGCNNLHFGPEPVVPQRGGPAAGEKPDELCFSEGQMLYMYEYSARIQCLSITEDTDHSFKVLINIFYLYSSEQDDQVQFSSSDPYFGFTLKGDPGPKLRLLSVEKIDYEKKAIFRITPSSLS